MPESLLNRMMRSSPAFFEKKLHARKQTKSLLICSGGQHSSKQRGTLFPNFYFTII
jgi:hypothetical protein